MTLEFIKDLVEIETGVKVVKNKKRATSRETEAKALFCELVYLFTDISEYQVSLFLKYNTHSTISNYRHKSYYADFHDYSFTIERKKLVGQLKLMTNKRALSIKSDIIKEIKSIRTLMASFSERLVIAVDDLEKIKLADEITKQ